MKCLGKPDTAGTIPRSITFSPLNFMLYRGKSINFKKSVLCCYVKILQWAIDVNCSDIILYYTAEVIMFEYLVTSADSIHTRICFT